MSGAAILLSGGMDSFALTYEQRPSLAVTVDYGQAPAAAEIQAAGILASELNIDHEIVRVDLSELGSGDLCGRAPLDVAPVQEWWPFRNQVLVSLAGMKLIGAGVGEIMLATVRSDEAHVDGSPEFVAAIDRLMVMQEGGIRVSAPAIDYSTSELIERSRIPLSLLAWSHSCHTGNIACGRCRGCYKNQAVWAELECNAVD